MIFFKMVEIQDENGNIIVSYAPPKAYNSVVISAPEITNGNTYTVKAGDTATEIKMTDVIYHVLRKTVTLSS